MHLSSGGVLAVTVPYRDTRRVGRAREVTLAQADETVDLATFVTLYESAYSRLVAQLTAVTGDIAEAEDVVQEAFVRAAQRWASIGTYDAPELWVRRVAINLAVSSLRRARRSATALLKWGRELEPGEVRGPDTVDLDRVALVEALRSLSVRYRVVLALHYLTDLDVKGIAQELDIPEATVKTRLARGRRRLREVLESAERAPSEGQDA